MNKIDGIKKVINEKFEKQSEIVASCFCLGYVIALRNHSILTNSEALDLMDYIDKKEEEKSEPTS